MEEKDCDVILAEREYMMVEELSRDTERTGKKSFFTGKMQGS